MKKGLLAFVLSFVLLVPSATAFAAEVDDGRAEAVEAATNLLAAFQLEGCPFEEFGFEPFDIDGVGVAAPIPDGSDGNVVYWPLVEGGRIVALVVQVDDEDGGSTYSLSSEGLDWAVSFGGRQGAYENVVSQDSVDSGMRLSGVVAAAGSNSSVFLPIATVMQGNTHNCWAAVVSSIAQYLTGIYKSPGEIALAITGSIDSGGWPSDAQRAFASYIYPDTGTAINTITVSGVMSDSSIRTYLNSKMPIYAGCYNATANRRHVIAVYGYTLSQSGSMTVSVMNPTGGVRMIMTKTGLYYSYTKDSGTWAWNDGAVLPFGWQRIGNTSWYYIQYDGSQSIGWTKISGNWYYFSEYGRMFWDEWISSGGKWYYVKTSGVMATNEWISSGGYWYHVDSDGAMQTGWYSDGSNWYYLRTATNVPASGPQGGMLANGSWYINGKTYHFNSSGVCTNP